MLVFLQHITKVTDLRVRDFLYRVALYHLWATTGELFGVQNPSLEPVRAMMALWVDVIHSNYQVNRAKIMTENQGPYRAIPPCTCAICVRPVDNLFNPNFFWNMWRTLDIPSCGCSTCSRKIPQKRKRGKGKKQPRIKIPGAPYPRLPRTLITTTEAGPSGHEQHQAGPSRRNTGPAYSQAGPSAPADVNIRPQSPQQPPQPRYARYVARPVRGEPLRVILRREPDEVEEEDEGYCTPPMDLSRNN